VQLDKPLPWFSNLTASFAFYPVQKANVESGANWTRPAILSATALCFKRSRG
jgi:oligopeptide transport system substrate-binding protein